MSATEIKLQIINKLNAIEDELILGEIYKLVSLESKMDSVYRLTDDERKAIDIGLKDVKDGRVYSSQVADNIINGRLEN